MTDTFAINEAQDGTITQVAGESIGGVKYPLQKIGYGAAGSFNEVADNVPLPVKQMPVTSGGLSRWYKKATADTNLNTVKNAAGQVYKIHAFNTSGATKYLKLYDKASNPLLASDVPTEMYPLAAGVMTKIEWEGLGMPFATGIALAITGGIADTDTTALALNDVIMTMGYK